MKDNLLIKKDIVSRHGDEIRDRADCYLEDYGVFAKTYEETIYGDVKVHEHVFHTADVTRQDRDAFFGRIREKEAELKEMLNRKVETTKEQPEDRYGKCFDLAYGAVQGEKPILKSYARDDGKITARYQRLGFHTIITDKPMTTAEALERYRLRDRVEKGFMCIKTRFDLKRLGTHGNESTEGKLFVAFVAFILRSILVEKTRELRLEKKDGKSYTVSACLGELSKIEASGSHLTDGKREIRYQLTNRQKTILDKMGVGQEAIRESLRKYNEAMPG